MNSVFYRKRRGLFTGMVEAFLLDEGLIASYDVKKLMRSMEEEFNGDITTIPPNQDEFSNENFDYHAYTFYAIVKNYNVNKSKIDQILNLYGYYVGKETESASGIGLNIEPRYPIVINKILELQHVKYLYHSTHRSNWNSIKKVGLAPRGTETTFYHPDDRIYLLISPENKIKNFINILAKDTNTAPDEFITFKTAYDRKYTYYLDDTSTSKKFGVIGCFVLKNIPPNELNILHLASNRDNI
jgi:hypothetical protein